MNNYERTSKMFYSIWEGLNAKPTACDMCGNVFPEKDMVLNSVYSEVPLCEDCHQELVDSAHEFMTSQDDYWEAVRPNRPR